MRNFARNKTTGSQTLNGGPAGTLITGGIDVGVIRVLTTVAVRVSAAVAVIGVLAVAVAVTVDVAVAVGVVVEVDVAVVEGV